MQGGLWIKCMRAREIEGLGNMRMKEYWGIGRPFIPFSQSLSNISPSRVIALKQLPKHARPPALRMIGIHGFGARNDFATLISSLETSIFVRNQRVAN